MSSMATPLSEAIDTNVWPVTFVKGQVIYADSAGGSTTGAQQLYNAIGAGNLRAYVQGQDDVGHAALANLSGRTPADTPQLDSCDLR
jgi:hypothetical protein